MNTYFSKNVNLLLNLEARNLFHEGANPIAVLAREVVHLMYRDIDMIRPYRHLVHARCDLQRLLFKVMAFSDYLFRPNKHFLRTALHLSGYIVQLPDAAKYLLRPLSLLFHRVADILFLQRHGLHACVYRLEPGQYVIGGAGDLVD